MQELSTKEVLEHIATSPAILSSTSSPYFPDLNKSVIQPLVPVPKQIGSNPHLFLAPHPHRKHFCIGWRKGLLKIARKY